MTEPSPASGSDAEAIRRLALDALGLEVTRSEPLAAGIGTRRFYRVHTGGSPATLVARIEAPEREDRRPTGVAPEPAFEPIRAFLEAQGLPVPARHAADEDAGIELLEDLGSTTLADVAPDERRALYAEVVDALPRLQRCEDPGGLPAFERRLDATLIAFKAELFVRHSLPTTGAAASKGAAEAVRKAFAWIASVVEAAPRRLAHRDLQSHNLLVRPGAGPGRRVAWIDLQGAFLAPPEYDLVCLLRDSYVELPDEEVAAHCARVRPRLPDAPSAEEFARRFDLLTLTRKGKDHARFLQAAEAGDPRWLDHVPTTVRALRAAAARCAALDPRLGRLAEVVERLPERGPERRCAP